MDKNITDFLNEYKRLENLLNVNKDTLFKLYKADEGFSLVKEYEDILSSDDSQKLRLCRNLRNYIQHNNGADNFISIHPNMVSFLEEINDRINCMNGIVKDKMKTIAKSPITRDTDKINDVTLLFLKKKIKQTIVLDKNNNYIGLISIDEILSVIGNNKSTKTTKVKDVMNTNRKDMDYFVQIAKETTPLTEIDKDKIIIVVDKANKIKGTII